jgi:hypothetical protein
MQNAPLPPLAWRVDSGSVRIINLTTWSFCSRGAMSTEQTNVALQRNRNQTAKPIVRGLLDRSVRRLHVVCAEFSLPRVLPFDLAAVGLATGRAARRRDGAVVQGHAHDPVPDSAASACAGSTMSWPDAQNSERSQESYTKTWSRRWPAAARCWRRTAATCWRPSTGCQRPR